MIYYPTVMALYSLFVLKVPLNPKQTNKQNRKLAVKTERERFINSSYEVFLNHCAVFSVQLTSQAVKHLCQAVTVSVVQY